MKTWYPILLSFFLTIFVSKSFAQNSFFHIKNIELEISPSLGEFKTLNSPFNETSSLGYGGGLGLGITNKSNWGFHFGVNFFSQEFSTRIPIEVIYSNPNNTISSMNDFLIDNLTNSFSTYNFGFTLQFDGTDCQSFDRPIVDGETINLRYLVSNKLQQIEIPIKIEKTIGGKPLKLYLGLGVAPTFVISNSLNFNKFGNSPISLTSYNRSRCYGPDNEVHRIDLIEQELSFQNQNVLDSRLDLISEFGLLHKGPRNTFKITFSFGESLTGFTEVDGIKHQSGMTRIKFSLGKNLYKSKAKSKF